MVKRYELVEGDCVEDTGLVEDDFGYWVEYPDYAALEARVAELEKDAARWRYVADQHSAAWADEIDDAMSREA